MKQQISWRWSSLERKCLELLQQEEQTNLSNSSLLQIHALMLRNALETNLSLLTKFITTISSSRQQLINHARRVFDHHAPPRDTFLCNAMIRAHMDTRQFGECWALYRELRRGGFFEPDGYTFTALAKASGSGGDVIQGEGIHCVAFKTGLCLDLYVSTSFVSMYVKFGRMGCAGKVFDEMTETNPVSWTALICGYARSGDMGNARRLFDGMPERDAAAFNAMIDGYVKMGEMGSARSLFDEMRDRNVVTWTSMIYGYCHRADVEAARSLFDSMPKRNLVSWNVMIGGYCQNKRPHEALRLFHEMQSTTSLEPDSVTIVSILPAIATLGALDIGHWIHEFAQRKKLDKLTSICTALVDMYAKCGDIKKAKRLFDDMPQKETASWNALINGFAVNGYGKEALEVFLEMQREHFKPNSITFIGVLSACNHCGLVEEGKRWFREMENFGIIQQIEHFGCMVDLLGRAGCLEEAEKLIESMPYDVNGIILSSFLFACGCSEDVRRANKILEQAIKLEPWNGGNYVMLRNLYARKKRWSDADDIKSLMQINQVDKEVGCSFIEDDGSIKQFVAGNRMHTSWEDVHLTLLQSWKHIMEEVSRSIT